MMSLSRNPFFFLCFLVAFLLVSAVKSCVRLLSFSLLYALFVSFPLLEILTHFLHRPHAHTLQCLAPSLNGSTLSLSSFLILISSYRRTILLLHSSAAWRISTILIQPLSNSPEPHSFSNPSARKIVMILSPARKLLLPSGSFQLITYRATRKRPPSFYASVIFSLQTRSSGLRLNSSFLLLSSDLQPPLYFHPPPAHRPLFLTTLLHSLIWMVHQTHLPLTPGRLSESYRSSSSRPRKFSPSWCVWAVKGSILWTPIMLIVS